MQRFDIIEKIGREYLISNIENDEFALSSEMANNIFIRV